jgi:septal ring factor EnvC (AmiA/AmiB activator)
LDSILLILAPPWPPSTTEDDKLSQILEHIKKLDRKVNVQDGVIAQLKDDNTTLKNDNAALHRKVNVQDDVTAQLKNDNAALKVLMGILEEDNQVLREAIDGVSAFA